MGVEDGKEGITKMRTRAHDGAKDLMVGWFSSVFFSFSIFLEHYFPDHRILNAGHSPGLSGPPRLSVCCCKCACHPTTMLPRCLIFKTLAVLRHTHIA